MTDRLDLKLGYKCNNFCMFCVNSREDRKLPPLSTHEVKNKISAARKEGANEVAFSGGEPTIHKEITELVRFAKKCGYPTIMLITNGRMLSKREFAEKLIEAGANKFMIAVHGDGKTHDRLTCVSGSYSQTIEGLKNAKELGASIITDTVVNKYNYKEIYGTLKQLISSGAEVCQLDFVIPSGMALANKEKIIPKLEEASPCIHQAIDELPRNDRDKIIVMGIPRCFMTGYEGYMNEPNIPDIEVSSSREGHSTQDYNQHRTKDKVKVEKCHLCTQNRTCEGIWKAYYDIHGFRPIIEKQKDEPCKEYAE